MPFTVDVRTRRQSAHQSAGCGFAAFAQGTPTITIPAPPPCPRRLAQNAQGQAAVAANAACVANSGFTGIGAPLTREHSCQVAPPLGAGEDARSISGCVSQQPDGHSDGAAIEQRVGAQIYDTSGNVTVASAESAASVPLLPADLHLRRDARGAGRHPTDPTPTTRPCRNTSRPPAERAADRQSGGTLRPGAVISITSGPTIEAGTRHHPASGASVQRDHGAAMLADPTRCCPAEPDRTHGSRQVRERGVHPGRGRPEQQRHRDDQRDTRRRRHHPRRIDRRDRVRRAATGRR